MRIFPDGAGDLSGEEEIKPGSQLQAILFEPILLEWEKPRPGFRKEFHG